MRFCTIYLYLNLVFLCSRRLQLDFSWRLLFVYHVYCLSFAWALLMLYYRMEKRCESKDVMRQYYWEVLAESCSSQDENSSSEPSCFESWTTGEALQWLDGKTSGAWGHDEGRVLGSHRGWNCDHYWFKWFTVLYDFCVCGDKVNVCWDCVQSKAKRLLPCL